MTDDGTVDPIDERSGIQSVEIAAKVLASLERGGGPLTLGEVAAGAGEQPSKVHRYLVSLCRVGLASQSPVSGRYDLGPAMRRLGAEALRRTNEVAIAAEHTPVLRDATGHSVNIAVWSEDGPVVVRWDYGRHALPLTVRLGATLPLLASSAGRLFLTHLPESMTSRALAASRASAPSLATVDVAALVAQTRAAGYATTSGGVIPGIFSMSAPILTPTDSLPIVATVVFPTEDVDRTEIDRVAELLLAMTRAVSRELGYVEPAD
jgi:DNA-binding IclR family transcriptional regulator